VTVRLFLLALASLALPAQPADLIITNARIWTANPDQPWAEAVAVKGARILRVGSAQDINALAGPQTTRVDAAGRLLTPGFNDAHIHLLSGSLRLFEVDLTGICTLDTMQAAVAKYAAANPGEQWITGGGWEYACFPDGRLPRKQDLDAVVKDRPVFLRAYDGHTAWANSKALEIAGVGKATAFTGFGEVVKDPISGEPEGCLKEGAMSLVSRAVPVPSRQRKLAALSRGLTLLASLGITSVQNASGNREELALYEELLHSGRLTARIRVAMSAGSDPAICSKLADLSGQFNGPLLRVDAVKFMLDGVVETHTAAMLQPYSDAPDQLGRPSWRDEDYRAAVRACDAAGWQVLTHAIGDRAVRMALNAYQGLKRGRPRIEHIEVVSPDDVPRFAATGTIASMEPIHADPGGVKVWSKAVGPSRLPYAFAWRSLEKAGAQLAFSSDWPASISLDPLRGIHNAVNRRTVEGTPPDGWIPEQRVSIESALRAYTAGAAFAGFDEKNTGSIEVGKLADLVVFSQDLFRVDPRQIHRTRVDITIFGGTIIHRRAP
jgi:predicted amidohydrolase YtcJ